jgi:hypothetical protein
MKSQQLTQILPSKDVRIITTPQKPYPSSLFRYYSTPYYWLLLAEGYLTRRLFGAMAQRIAALPVPAG